MVMTSTSASVEANLVTFIVKNLLSKDAIVTFVVDTELYFIQMFILNGLFFRVKVPFNIPLHTMYGRYNMCLCMYCEMFSKQSYHFTSGRNKVRVDRRKEGHCHEHADAAVTVSWFHL